MSARKQSTNTFGRIKKEEERYSSICGIVEKNTTNEARELLEEDASLEESTLKKDLRL